MTAPAAGLDKQVRGRIEEERARVVEVWRRNGEGEFGARRYADRAVEDLVRLVDLVADLGLTAAEWHTVEWFIGWDAVDNIASIVAKARVVGAVSAGARRRRV